MNPSIHKEAHFTDMSVLTRSVLAELVELFLSHFFTTSVACVEGSVHFHFGPMTFVYNL